MKNNGQPSRSILLLGAAMILVSCDSNNGASDQPAKPLSQAHRAAAAPSISRKLADIYTGLTADLRMQRSENSVDTYAIASHWRVMPDETKQALNAKMGYVGEVSGQLVMLGSDGTNDIFSLSAQKNFDPAQVLEELQQVYDLRELASDTSDGSRMNMYSMKDHGVAVGVLTISYGVVAAIAGTGTIAFVSSERFKKEMPSVKL